MFMKYWSNLTTIKKNGILKGKRENNNCSIAKKSSANIDIYYLFPSDAFPFRLPVKHSFWALPLFSLPVGFEKLTWLSELFVLMSRGQSCIYCCVAFHGSITNHLKKLQRAASGEENMIAKSWSSFICLTKPHPKSKIQVLQSFTSQFPHSICIQSWWRTCELRSVDWKIENSKWFDQFWREI